MYIQKPYNYPEYTAPSFHLVIPRRELQTHWALRFMSAVSIPVRRVWLGEWLAVGRMQRVIEHADEGGSDDGHLQFGKLYEEILRQNLVPTYKTEKLFLSLSPHIKWKYNLPSFPDTDAGPGPSPYTHTALSYPPPGRGDTWLDPTSPGWGKYPGSCGCRRPDR